MKISSGQAYTFHFSSQGHYFGLSLERTAIEDSITKAGFPVAILGGQEAVSGVFGTVSEVEIAFNYNGQDTDDISLGNAIQDQFNQENSAVQINYESADEGNTLTGSISASEQQTGADVAQPAKTAASLSMSALASAFKGALAGAPGNDNKGTGFPSLTTIGLLLVGALILTVAVYSFAGAAGRTLAAKV